MRSAFIRVTSYVRFGEALERRAVVFPPLRPSRKTFDRLSRYDRLDPAASPRPAQPKPEVEPGSPMDAVAGMERLRAALDSLAEEVNRRGFVWGVDSARGHDMAGEASRGPDGRWRVL
jgi:hypothetical protein